MANHADGSASTKSGPVGHRVNNVVRFQEEIMKEVAALAAENRRLREELAAARAVSQRLMERRLAWGVELRVDEALRRRS